MKPALIALFVFIATNSAQGQLQIWNTFERRIQSERQQQFENSVLSNDWQRQHPIESGWWLMSVSVVDSMPAWAAGWHDSAAGLIVRTTDGGENWIEQTRTLPLNLNDIHFATDSLGWVVGGDNIQFSGFVLRTTDSGQSWTTQYSATRVRFWSVFFLDAMRGWVVGDSGKILTTTNAGSDWQTQESGYLTLRFFLLL